MSDEKVAKKKATKKAAKKGSTSKRVYKSRAKVPVKGEDPYKLIYQSPEKVIRAMQMKGGISVETTYYDGSDRVAAHFISGGEITRVEGDLYLILQ